MNEKIRNDERGTSMAEFAIVAGFFFLLIFGIIEFGRLLYTHNALTDAARRGARYAVLNPNDAPCVEEVVVYGESNINPVTCTPSGPPLVYGLTTANVVVHYNGDPANPLLAYGMNLGTASVTIQNYAFRLSIPFVGRTINMPIYRTTLPAESAGTGPPNL